MLDMGDFAGGMLKYLRTHPVARVTIGGGFAKLSKLALGHLDLHSGRSQVDVEWLASRVEAVGAAPGTVDLARAAHTALEVLEIAGAHAQSLAADVAVAARLHALEVLGGAEIAVGVVVVDRDGQVLADVS
jgi:cobalt-precorrin-5B (C1)-methyltransferase